MVSLSFAPCIHEHAHGRRRITDGKPVEEVVFGPGDITTDKAASVHTYAYTHLAHKHTLA